MPAKKYRIAELQDLAYRVMTRPKPSKLALPTYFADGSTAALFGHWLTHKEIGTPVTSEVGVHPDDGGGVAVITARGIVLRWREGVGVEAL